MSFTGKRSETGKSREIREGIYELLENGDLVMVSSTSVLVVAVGIENKLEENKEVLAPLSQIINDKPPSTNPSYGGSKARRSSRLRIKKLRQTLKMLQVHFALKCVLARLRIKWCCQISALT
jgi:hypothetical protein